MKKTSLRQRATDPKRITLKQIADEVGVHVMTVSRALHGAPGRTADETRSRIRLAAERLGYRPNLMAQALQTGYSHNIGVIIRPRSEFGGKLLSGVHDGLASQGWLPMVHYQPEAMGQMADPKVELELIHSLLDRRVDGLIVFPSDAQASDQHFSEIWERQVPLVAVDHFLHDTHADFSGTDDVMGGHLAGVHLRSLGHARFGLLRGDQRFTAYRDRAQGFLASVEGCHVDIADLQTEQESEVRTAVQSLLQRPQRPTALVCANDHVAAGALRVCREMQVRVPQDISIIGYADLSFAQHLSPQLTTVSQDPYAVGLTAADLILRRCQGEDGPPRQVRQAPNLMIRASTGPAPAPSLT